MYKIFKKNKSRVEYEKFGSDFVIVGKKTLCWISTEMGEAYVKKHVYTYECISIDFEKEQCTFHEDTYEESVLSLAEEGVYELVTAREKIEDALRICQSTNRGNV